MVTAKMIRKESKHISPGKSPFPTWEGLEAAKERYASEMKQHRIRKLREIASHCTEAASQHRHPRRSLSISTVKTDASASSWDAFSGIGSPTGLRANSFDYVRQHREVKEEAENHGARVSRAMSIISDGGISFPTTRDNALVCAHPHQKFAEEFDRKLFLHMSHPLDGKDGNLSANLETLWQIQYALKDLRRYLRSRGDQKLWDYIPCKDPTSVSVERVFEWLQSLKYSLKMAPKKPPPTFTVVKSSQRELGAFVKGMTPEMIECVIKYVDCDGNGEIDIAELDLAFRLSRIEIDDCFEVPEDEDLTEASQSVATSVSHSTTTRLGASVRSSSSVNNNSAVNNSLSGASTSPPSVTFNFSSSASASSGLTLTTRSVGNYNHSNNGNSNPSVFSTTINSRLSGSTSLAATVKEIHSTNSSVAPPPSTAAAPSDDYGFFLDTDVLTLLTFLQFDKYGMIDIRKASQRLRQLKRIKVTINRRTAKVDSYFELVCERLMGHGLRPHDFVVDSFHEQAIMVPLPDFRDALYQLLRGDVPEAFFGPDYQLFEAELERLSSSKGHVNKHLFENRLDASLGRLRVVSLNSTMRRPNENSAEIVEAIDRIESVVYARYFLRIPEYFKFLDTERTGRLTYAKIKDALMTLSRAPPLNIMAHKLIAEKRAKICAQEAERRRKDRQFLNKLIKMKNLGVTQVLRKFERFMRERGMRLQDFFNLVDEDRSGRLTPDELMQALLLFANRPENPQRFHERQRRKAALNKLEYETKCYEEEHKVFMREMRELENMGAHSALLKMTRFLRRYQRTFDMVFDAEDEEGDEYVIGQDEIWTYFQRAYVTRAEAERLYDYFRGRITVGRIEEASRKYARYRRVLKHNTMRTEEDAGLPLFSFDKMMMILRFFFWADVSMDDYPDADLRISLVEFQNAIDNEEKRHVIDYASDFRASRYQQRREKTEDSASSFLTTHRPPNRSISFT